MFLYQEAKFPEDEEVKKAPDKTPAPKPVKKEPAEKPVEMPKPTGRVRPH